MAEAENSISYQCASCAKKFRRLGEYNKHRKIHDRPYKCHLCPKIFALETDRKRHRKLHQAALPQIQCPLSPCKFRGTNREDYFWKHLNQKHGGTLLSHDTRRRLLSEAKEKHAISQKDEQNLLLLEASYQGDDVLVAELLLEGVDVDTETANGETPLHLAVNADHETIVTRLLEAGADVNILRGREGRNARAPLTDAINRGHEGIVKSLLESGAGANGVYGSNPPLWEAVKSGHESIVKILLESGADANRIYGSNPPLLEAVKSGHESIVKILLEKGADINLHRGYWTTTLYAAAYEGSEALVSLLLEYGADINCENGLSHETALHGAIENRHLAVVDLLLKRRAEVNLSSTPGLATPLHTACEQQKVGPHLTETVEGAIVRLLLQAGADIEAKDYHGRTPLSYAIGYLRYGFKPEYYFEEGVKLLLEAGAMISTDDWNYLPVDLQNAYASKRIIE